jgi:ABC transport system ATP-binding/permease protein
MALLSLRSVKISFGQPPLLDNAELQLERGERVVLVGRNGSGKTSLLKCLAGSLEPTSGERYVEPGLRISYLPQEIPPEVKGTVYQVVASGLARQGELLTEYHFAATEVARESSPATLARLAQVQQELEEADGWQLHQQVERTLADLTLHGLDDFSTRSGGVKRRVLLARALVANPDLLLLDEPTNHLDIETIGWLEERLLRFQGTLLLITHDRMLARRVANRILQIDRGQLTSWECGYDTFRERKIHQLEVEAANWNALDKKLAKEEVWVRKGIKARRTRNEGRVRALEKLRDVRTQRREEMGRAKLQLQKTKRSGDMVMEAEEINFGYTQEAIVKDFSCRIVRGDKLGVLGPNGSGKTTLLRLLLGELVPGTGRVAHGTELEVVYFDQLRSSVDPGQSVREAVADGREIFMFDGRPMHIYAYLKNFLFPRDRVDMPVEVLSGGERNRLVLARLFTYPSNVLVLDEPTNDLDVETLELLEELLIGYTGTLLLVSHDREFLNNVVTSTYAVEGEGTVVEYAGGYDDWLDQRPPPVEEVVETAPRARRVRAARPRKLTFKEARELEQLEPRIEALELEKAALFDRMADPGFYKQAGEDVALARRRTTAIEEELEVAYARWEELEAIKEGQSE